MERLDEDATAPQYYSATEVDSALNMAERLFVLLTLCLKATGALPLTAGTAHYRLFNTFPYFLLPLRVRVAGGAALKPVRLEELDALNPRWQASAGVPVRYAALGFDFLSVYQQPAAGGTSLDITYARCPAPMVADAAAPSIPEAYHAALIDAAIPLLRLKEGGQEFEKALPLFDRFLQDARKLAQYVTARNLAARYDRTPYEIQSADLSKLVNLAIKPLRPAMLNIPQAQGETQIGG